MLMKDDITRGKNAFAIKVINTVALLAKGITQEKAATNTNIKFVGEGKVGSIA